MSIEDKIKEELPVAFNNSKSWCINNLPKELKGYTQFNFDIFRYIIDNRSSTFSDMYFNPKENGLIRVNDTQIKWQIKKRSIFPYSPEVDLESMFVHEMVEYIVDKTPEILVNYFPKEMAHQIARRVENVNRKERNLKEWNY